jgi:uncharacterized membrane protein
MTRGPQEEYRRMMPRLSRYFFQGLLIVAPIGITAYVFYLLFNMIDQPLRRLIMWTTGHDLPGLGFLIFVVLGVGLCILAGFLSGHLIARGMFSMLERATQKVPAFRLLHNSFRDFFGAFVGDKKAFDQPVLISVMPGSDIRMVGFVTRKTLDMWDMADHVAVYVPMAFTFGGNLLIIPRERLTPLKAASSDALAFIVSGGIAWEKKNGEADAAKVEG